MKTILTILMTLATQASFAASLHCDVWNSENKQITAFDQALPEATDAGISLQYKVASLEGIDAVAYVTIAKGLSENFRLFAKLKGVSVYAYDSILLTSQLSKKTVDVRCEILNATPYAPVEIPAGPTLN